jgi:hypothetical protein
VTARRRQIAAAAWLVIALVVGNGTYDLIMTRAVEHTLRRAAMAEAGRGPAPDTALAMRDAIYDATWKGTLAGSLILLAGLITIRYVGKTPG